uniref:Integrase core domain containing protein n=1 Tax=Solanum tuberosum TaxID=4113 RepID=M1DYS9_SOLTU
MPQLIERDVLAAEKSIKDEMRKELAILKNNMDSLEAHVQTQLQAVGSGNIEEFKKHLAEMRTQVAKLAEKPVQVPTPVMAESLMKIFSEQPTIQSLDDLWGELPKGKFGKRKHRAREFGEEIPADMYIEERRKEKKARKASRTEAREKEAFAQQQRDAVLAGTSGSGVSVPVSGSQADPALVFESVPVDKCSDANPTTGA